MSRLAPIVVLLVSAHAFAQPGAAPPPPLPPAPQIVVGQWLRLSLEDGRFVDGYITGGDAYHVFVQTSHGHFSIVRATILTAAPLAAPVDTPAPTPVPVAPPVDRQEKKAREMRAGGVVIFGLFYGITAVTAAAKMDDDETAKYGLIPVAGPLMWALRDDEDDGGEDGWDYLAGLDCLLQGMGVLTFITGAVAETTPKTTVTAVSRRDFAGISVAGSW